MKARLDRDAMMMEMAKVVSARGTCSRLQVGAIISRQSRVISMGYNGTPAGMPHCVHTLDETTPCDNAVHAEANAIVWAARNGISTEGASLFVTHMPCLKCAQLIVNAGIVRVRYLYSYRLLDGVKLLAQAGVDVRSLDGFFN